MGLSVGILLTAILASIKVSATELMSLQLSAENNVVSNVSIVRENTELRDEFSKHFINSDGTVTAVTYSESVHYIKDGQWVEIDNRLNVDETGRISNNYEVMSVSFAQRANDNSIVSLCNSGYEISWDITAIGPPNQNAGLSVASASQADFYSVANIENVAQSRDYLALDADEKALSADKISSQIEYQDIFGTADSIDLNYDIRPDRVKESIILNEITEITTFKTVISADGLSAYLNADNSVVFTDQTGKIVFNILTPHMFDSADEVSYDIDVTLTPQGEDYVLAITPNAQWLHAEERVYPITIDPTITLDTSASNVLDTYTYPGDTEIRNNESKVYIGNKLVNGTRKKHIAYFKLKSVPSIPSNTIILDSYLKYNFSPATTTAQNINVYTTMDDWSSAAFSWSNKPFYQTGDVFTIAENISPTYSSGAPTHYKIDLTGRTYETLKGFVIEYVNPTVEDYNGIMSSDSSTNGPVFYVTYDTSQASGINNGGMYSIRVAPSSCLMATGTTNNSLLSISTLVTGSTQQKFYVNYRGSGLYSLKAYGTTKVVSTDGTYVGLHTDYSQDEQLWYISKVGDYYTIRSKKYPTYYISNSNARLTTTACQFSFNQIDVITLRNYYDNSFLNNKGSVTNVNNHINTACNILKDFFETHYGVFVVFSSTAISYSSLSDKQGHDVDAQLMVDDIFYAKTVSSDCRIIPMLWTGSSDASNSCVALATGENNFGRNAAVIFRECSISNDEIGETVYAIIHEFANIMGARTNVGASHSGEKCIFNPLVWSRADVGKDMMIGFNFVCNEHINEIATLKANYYIPYCATHF